MIQRSTFKNSRYMTLCLKMIPIHVATLLLRLYLSSFMSIFYPCFCISWFVLFILSNYQHQHHHISFHASYCTHQYHNHVFVKETCKATISVKFLLNMPNETSFLLPLWPYKFSIFVRMLLF